VFKSLVRNVGCILIARLAVDKKLHGYGVGSYLLSLAVGYAMESPLGCRYLAVDPKDGALEFYEKIGFSLNSALFNNQTRIYWDFNIHLIQNGSLFF